MAFTKSRTRSPCNGSSAEAMETVPVSLSISSVVLVFSSIKCFMDPPGPTRTPTRSSGILISNSINPSFFHLIFVFDQPVPDLLLRSQVIFFAEEMGHIGDVPL